MEFKKDLINVFRAVIDAFNKYNPAEIMELSNHIIHSLSIYQDKRLLSAAIVIYSLGKIVERGKIRRFPQEKWNAFVEDVKSGLIDVLVALKSDDWKSYDKSIKKLQRAIMKIDQSFMEYIGQVFDAAKLKKGVKVVEHGVSLGRVSELFGISLWELMHYLGKRSILEREEKESDVKERMEKVRKIFGDEKWNILLLTAAV